MYKNIFVDGIMHLGDMIISATVFPILKKAYPQAKISYLVPSGLVQVAEMLEGVDQVIPYAYQSKGGAKEVFATAQELQKQHFDLGISLDPRERVTLMKWLAKMPLRVSMEQALGWKLGWERWFYHQDLALPQGWNFREHLMGESYSVLMSQFVGAPDTEFHPTKLLPSQPQDLLFAKKLLGELSSPSKTNIAFCVQSSNPAKDWSAASFAQLANQLIATWDANIIITGIPLHEAKIQQIIKGIDSPERVLNIANRTDFKQLVALLRQVDLLVSLDTGTAHIAGAVDCPVVTLFTVQTPKIYRPASDTSIAVSGNLPCSGKDICTDNVNCPRSACTDALTLELVMDSIKKLIPR